MKRYFFYVDADNRAILTPSDAGEIKFKEYEGARVSIINAGNGSFKLEMHYMEDGWILYRSEYHTDVELTPAQIRSLENAWHTCSVMPILYWPRLWFRRKIFFSLVLRDSKVREIFTTWISNSSRSSYITKPNLVVSGPVAIEVL